MNGRRLGDVAWLIGLYLWLFPGKVHAYLDPGTGSLILQEILAALFSSLMTLKIYWKKIRQVLATLFSRVPKQKGSHD